MKMKTIVSALILSVGVLSFAAPQSLVQAANIEINKSTLIATPVSTLSGEYTNGVQYTKTRTPVISVNVTSSVELKGCELTVALKPKDGTPSSQEVINVEPILVSSGIYKCNFDFKALNYSLEPDGLYEFNLFAYDSTRYRDNYNTAFLTGFTVDLLPPVTKVLGIIRTDGYEPNLSVRVEGKELGVAIESYKVMYSLDNGPWLEGTPCPGIAGSPFNCPFGIANIKKNGTYRFYVYGIDFVGNVEQKSPVAEASYEVDWFPKDNVVDTNNTTVTSSDSSVNTASNTASTTSNNVGNTSSGIVGEGRTDNRSANGSTDVSNADNTLLLKDGGVIDNGNYINPSTQNQGLIITFSDLIFLVIAATILAISGYLLFIYVKKKRLVSDRMKRHAISKGAKKDRLVISRRSGKLK